MSFSRNNYGITSFLILCVAIYLSFTYLLPSETVSVKINQVEFSQQKALIHLKEISQKQHYVGAPAHKEVRDYIVNQLKELGLEVEIQHQLGINKKWHSATQAQNILARIKGTSSAKSLLLLTHYDSNPHSSLGASDAGSGVVTILEGLRVYLETNQKPKNDIVILISDAEEIGLNGADAFVNHHPWAKNVGLVLNFEARGSGGPSYMLLETNGGNATLIKEFLKANPQYPVANSLMYSLYKMLPNDTDLTVFREDGNINGFNFAFIGDHFDYHTAQDSYNRLDRNTLMQQASYLLPLLNYFSNADLSQLNSQDDLVYFTVPIVKMISYPFAWVTPLTIMAFVLFFLLCLFGLMKGKISLKGIGIGFAPLLLSFLIAVSVALFGWKLLLIIHPQYHDILHGFTYNGYDYIAAFVALSFAITYGIYNKFKQKQALNLSIAPIFLWLIINVLIAIYLKGSGFFIIPVYFALSGLAIEIFSKNKSNKILTHSLLALPMLVIFAPLVKMFPVGLGLKNLFISSIFVVLMMGLLVPVLSRFKARRFLVIIGFAIAVLFFVKAALNAGYSIDQKKPNSILYIYDADAQKAYWTTYDRKLDTFTKQFLGSNPIKGGVDKKTVASKYSTNQTWHKEAKLIDLKMPLLIKTERDSILIAKNTYQFTITPQRYVNRIEFIANTNLHFIDFSLNGQTFTKEKGGIYVFDTETRKHLLSYYFTQPDESITLKFTLKEGEKPDITFYEASYNLFTNPSFDITPRSEIMMPTPFVLNDAIVIKKLLNP
ncbi:MAG: M20/M25/M40 family metallo-hydrolase [Flavobacteriaceae bacterium]|nr:M20/M25/M40 family metallo-hydrolase [Flavobacteriaceae bacterium]